MNAPNRLRWTGLCALVAWGMLGAGAGRLPAGEPFEEFLAGLRERNLYDTALEYLQVMQNSTLLTPEQKSTIAYEEGRTLIDYSTFEQDGQRKLDYLDKGQTKLQEFLKANPSHAVAGGATLELGRVLVERGRFKLQDSAKPRNAANKDKLVEECRKLFAEAQKVFDEAEKKFLAELDKIPKVLAPNTPEAANRDRVLALVLQASMSSAAITYELSKTYPEASDNWKKLVQAAADKYQKVYEGNRLRIAGQVARIKQGQCYQELGDTRRALGLYADILGQPDDIRPFRKYKAAAMYLTLQCWNIEKRYELAVEKGEEWVTKWMEPGEEKLPDYLAIRWFLAQAYDEFAKAQKTEDAKKKKLALERDHLKLVARYAGTYRDLARVKLKELQGTSGVEVDPTTLADALELAKVKMEEYDGKFNAQPPTPPEELTELRDECKRILNLALTLSQKPVKPEEKAKQQEDVNDIRYRLCYLNFREGRYYDAAVMGEFLARNYPAAAFARSCCELSLKAYYFCYEDAKMPPELRSFDREQMVRMAEYTSTRFPGEKEAVGAWNLVFRVTVVGGDLAAAEKYLLNIGEAELDRGLGELLLGQMYWKQYVDAVNKPEADRPPKDQLDALMGQARRCLELGVPRVKAKVAGGAKFPDELAWGQLLLAQIYVSANEPAKALELIEDKATGLLTLVTAKDAKVMVANLPTETYKMAIRAYVNNGDMKRAVEIMKPLEELVTATGGDGVAKLTSIYVAIGGELERKIAALRASNETDKAKKLEEDSKAFLDAIASRDVGVTFASLDWIAGTYYRLGDINYPIETVPPSAEAKEYYKKSADISKKIFDRIAKDPKFLPKPEYLLSQRLRVARCLRKADQYAEAQAMLMTILDDKQFPPGGAETAVQIEAAQLFTDAADFEKAINGFTPPPPPKRTKRLFEGWLGISNKMGSQVVQMLEQARAPIRKAADTEKAAVVAKAELAEKPFLDKLVADLNAHKGDTKTRNELRAKYRAGLEQRNKSRDAQLAAIDAKAEAAMGTAIEPLKTSDTNDAKIFRLVANYYHEARYNLLRTMELDAEKKPTEGRKETLDQALLLFESTVKLMWPIDKLGQDIGLDWYDKYNTVYLSLKKKLGSPAKGIAEDLVPKPEAAPKAPAAAATAS